jgi:HSP20 family protein
MATRSLLPRLWQEDPFPLKAFRRDLDDLFESWATDLKLPDLGGWARTDFWPRVNVSETEKELQVTAELPGVDEKNIDVTVSGDQLTIRGEKKSEIDEKKDEKGRAFRRVERSYGSFERTMSLPFDIDPDKVQASFKNGVLTLTLPKPPGVQKKSKKIEISGEAQPAQGKKAA